MAGAGTALADIFEVAHRDGQTLSALDELAVRADRIGAGPLLDEWAKRRVSRLQARRRWIAKRGR